MTQKKRKSKTSFVKRGNQLRTKLLKQGKLKTRRNRPKRKHVSKPKKITNTTTNISENENSDHEEDVLNMIEKEDIDYLRNEVIGKRYSFLKGINGSELIKPKRQKRKAEDNVETLESEYEQTIEHSDKTKKMKYLLPIKTSEGIVMRSEELSDIENDEIEEKQDPKDEIKSPKEFEFFNENTEVTNADLLAQRQNTLMQKKFRIGILCSGLTETPELKIKNFKPLLEMLSENDPEVCITVKKIVIVSLLEIFKDLLPSYQIKHHNDSSVKLKKAVKQLRNFENDLVKYYKEYLKELEKIISILRRKKGDHRVFKEPEIKLAELALNCMCELLTTHPYFNFSKNIINLIVPFLNNWKENVRASVSSAFKEIFKMDKRGEISLEVVRNVNKLVKTKSNILHSEVLTIFLSLKLKDVNLDKEKEEELRKKKEMAKKQKFLKLSKRERKRNKKFQELQKELLETKAEENKKCKEHYLTEITKILFTIYFRVLKLTPCSKLLNAALEGLAKFAHCINIEFYQDLIIVLEKLVQNENLGYKEKLCCAQTVFTILFYQGATIHIDPIKFYSNFYANILEINAGKNHSDLPYILRTTEFVLLKRQKHVSLQKLLAFTKRLSHLALQVLPNGTLALLNSVKQILQINNSLDVLLDLDGNERQGVYFPELNEPEYCNAGATSLWELFLLQNHYHPTVREYASYIAKVGCKPQDVSHKNLFKQSPEQLFEQFETADVKFNPAVPAPKKFPKTQRKGQEILSLEFEEYVKHNLEEFEIKL